MSWPQALLVLMLCKRFLTWILLFHVKLALYMFNGLVTVFLYNCSSIRVRTEVVSKKCYCMSGMYERGSC